MSFFAPHSWLFLPKICTEKPYSLTDSLRHLGSKKQSVKMEVQLALLKVIQEGRGGKEKDGTQKFAIKTDTQRNNKFTTQNKTYVNNQWKFSVTKLCLQKKLFLKNNFQKKHTFFQKNKVLVYWGKQILVSKNKTIIFLKNKVSVFKNGLFLILPDKNTTGKRSSHTYMVSL